MPYSHPLSNHIWLDFYSFFKLTFVCNQTAPNFLVDDHKRSSCPQIIGNLIWVLIYFTAKGEDPKKYSVKSKNQ